MNDPRARPRAYPVVPSNLDLARLATLRSELDTVGPLRDEAVAIPGTNLSMIVTRPVDTDALLERAARDPEQNLPYWSEIWPSGIALAAAIAREPHLVCGRRVLELGCGVGVTAALALAHGAELTVTDYAPEALTLTRLTARRFTGREPETLRLNWRAPTAAFRARTGAGYPVVLAADVLYEKRDIDPLLDLLDRIVAPGGLLLLAEPGRPPARAFLDRATAAGWRGPATEWDGPWPDPGDVAVRVRVHALCRQGRAYVGAAGSRRGAPDWISDRP